MKKRAKLRIKSLPRFITFSLISLAIIFLFGMLSVTLVTNVVSAINTQKEKTQASASLVEASQNTTIDTAEIQAKADAMVAPNDEEKQTVTDDTAASDDPLECTKKRLRNNDTEGLKVVFLTFDDGPSEHTGEVLDILDTYDAKATFFTNYHDGEVAEAAYRRIVNEGHTLANHTSSHNYDLYNNPDAFYSDVQSLDQYQRQVTGLTETSHIFRFPGGSMNANETCVLGMVKRGWNYADWNVSSGDGGSDPPGADGVTQNIVNGCHEHDVSVVLCHAESKSGTLAALPKVIKTLQDEGYTFLPMEKDYTYPRQLEV